MWNANSLVQDLNSVHRVHYAFSICLCFYKIYFLDILINTNNNNNNNLTNTTYQKDTKTNPVPSTLKVNAPSDIKSNYNLISFAKLISST